MSKKVLVLTGTTDILRQPNETDNTMEEVFDLTLPSKVRYANKHGYDLVSLRSFGSDKNNLFEDRKLGFLRELRTFEMLEHYDIVMWIDADSVITNDIFTVNDFQLDTDHCFYASWDWTGKLTFSTGNFIIQRTDSTNEMFDAFLKVGKYVIDTNQWGEELTTMNLIYRQTNLGKHIKILEHKFLGAIPSRKMYRGIWDGRPEPQYPWSEDCFLCHITGVPNKNRIEVLKTTFEKYL